jgi:hypothetical protein
MISSYQSLIAAEIGEHRGFGHAQALRDLGGGGRLEAGFGEDLAGDAQDVADALFGFGAGRRSAHRDGGGFFHAGGVGCGGTGAYY